MAAKWGSWDDSLVFLKPHFGALWSISPLFCLVMALSAPIYVTVTFACLWCLACSIWGQDAENGIFSLSEASLPITGHSCLPGMSAFLFLFLAFSWEREGSWSGLRWTAAGSWPLPPLHGLLRAGWMACYFTEFPNILAGIIFSADQETDSTRLWFAQQYIAARGVSNHYCRCSAGIGCELLAITVLFQIFFSNYFWTCSSNLKGKGTDLSQMLSRICSFCSSTHSVALLCQSGGT